MQAEKQVKRFVAADMRRALELVRAELGPDAIILSNRRTRRGVEILTTLDMPAGGTAPLSGRNYAEGFSDSDQPLASDNAWRDQLGVDAAVNQHRRAPGGPDLQAVRAGGGAQQSFTAATGPASGKTPAQLAEEMERARERMLEARSAAQQAPPAAAVEPPPEPAVVRSTAAEEELQALKSEIAGMRQLLAEQLGRLAPAQPLAQPAAQPSPQSSSQPAVQPLSQSSSQPAAQPLSQSSSQPAAQPLSQSSSQPAAQPLSQSSSQPTAQPLSQSLAQPSAQPPSPSRVHSDLWQRFRQMGLADPHIAALLNGVKSHNDITRAWREALACLCRQLPVAGGDITAGGGVFAFVGPAGAGKTTTIGKLAARFVLQRGADQVALVSTDGRPAAAGDQLRSFGRILNVPLRVAAGANDLAAALQSLRQRSLVLIDTAGLRHGDPLLKCQLEALRQHREVQKLLVLPCDSQLQTLKASLHAYGSAGLSACVLTKLDASASLGELLGLLMAQQLPVAYTADGQNIPRDIVPGRAPTLVAKAVGLLKQSLKQPSRQHLQQHLQQYLQQHSQPQLRQRDAAPAATLARAQGL